MIDSTTHESNIAQGEQPFGVVGNTALYILLFLCLFVVYNLNARFIAGSDVYSTRYMPVNLVLNHTYYFPENLPKQLNWNLGTRVDDPESPSFGKFISVYPTYTPTLLVPLYWIFFSPSAMGLSENHYLVFYLDKWISSVIVALACLMTFSLIRRLHGGRIGMALMTTVALGVGTSFWAIASQGSWAMGPSAFYMICAVWALERAVRLIDAPQSRLWALVAGWALASAFATRLTDIFFVLPFFIFSLYELRKSKSAIACLFAGIFPVAAWFTIHNYIYFGNPLVTGYKYNLAQLRIPHLMHIENFFSGFFGLLFSPSLGMFTTAPITLFALPGMVSILKTPRRVIERRSTGELIEYRPPRNFIQRAMMIAIPFSIFHTLFYSCYLEWWAGWSFCYRYLIDIQPFLFICIGWFFRPTACCLKYRIPMFMPALAFSIFMQFFGAFFWFGRIFDKLSKNNPTYERLYLNLDPKKPHKGIFNHDSFFFSLDRDDYIVFTEGFPTRQNAANGLMTWDKLYQDLYVSKTVDWHPHIILYCGLKN